MKTSLALLSALCLLALAAPAQAHHSAAEAGYLVFWKGVPPKSGIDLRATASSGIWNMAFISKYRILGAQLPSMP